MQVTIQFCIHMYTLCPRRNAETTTGINAHRYDAVQHETQRGNYNWYHFLTGEKKPHRSEAWLLLGCS